MNNIPDAPYIQEAQQFGVYSPDPVPCPVCGRRCELIYKSREGEVFACDQCIRREDAYEWQEENKRRERV